MVFTSTDTDRGVRGNKRVVTGTYTNTGGSTGGEIVTGLKRIEHLSLVQTGAAVTTGAPVANETFPLDSGDVTIVTDADADGIWEAVGN